jgi:hypothetical protein
MKRLLFAVGFSICAILAAWAGVNNAAPIAVNGLISFLGLSSGTSGGVPYFSSSSALSSSAALASTGIVIGGGAGAAPTSTGCLINSNNEVTCTSSNSSSPKLVIDNTTNDANGPYFVLQKEHGAGSAVGFGDTLGQILSSGYANGGIRNAAAIFFQVNAALSGSNVPSKIFLNVTDAAGTSNIGSVLDNNVHQSFFSSGVPALTSCGTGSPTVRAGSTDVAGELTEGTSAAGCTLTFKVAYGTAPYCTVTSQTQLAAFTYAVATGTIIITNTSTSGDKINWVCHGN